MKNLKVLFFGTPQIAVPFLDWLHKNTTVAGVVCRPDEPVGRGYKITAPPTKRLALDCSLPIFQPHGSWSENDMKTLSACHADIGVIVAYGRILPRSIFSIPKMGCVNIHFSLLPKYRGAAPMQWALIRGEEQTGVTTFCLEEGLDSGPIADQRSVVIEKNDDIVSLREKLVASGLLSLEKVMKDAISGTLQKTVQVGEPTPAPQLKKEDGFISWAQSARDIVNLIRGVKEWPGALTKYAPADSTAKQLKIFLATADMEDKRNSQVGAIVSADKNGILVTAAQGYVRLMKVQPEGKKEMNAWDFWQGARLKAGDQLG